MQLIETGQHGAFGNKMIKIQVAKKKSVYNWKEYTFIVCFNRDTCTLIHWLQVCNQPIEGPQWEIHDPIELALAK